jgi:hypothetical protein
VLAAGGFLAGILLASVLGAIALAFTHDDNGPALLTASFVGLWVPLVGAAVITSRSFGTRSVRRDLGLAFEPFDVARGALVGIVGLVAAAAVQQLLSPFPDLVGTNTNFIEDQATSFVGAAVVVGSTMVGAPFVEELFFRGLLQRSMVRLGVAAAFVQALVFGLIHVTPTEGLGNVGIVLGVGVFGLVLGLAARHYGRLGPTMVAHALFNAAAVVPVLLR